MIEESIVVSDSNIFFDLIAIDLLKEFFMLSYKIVTTDFVISEIIRPEQLRKIEKYIKSKQLYIKEFNSEELSAIIDISEKSNNNVSITDCSVWYYAKKTNGRLLTGDAKLRKSATKDNVKVSGFLYILDSLIEYNILDKKVCADKLEQLLIHNSRLPKDECESRIASWRR